MTVYSNIQLLSGWRDLEGPRLWHFPLQPTPPAAPTEHRPPTRRLSVPFTAAPAWLRHTNVWQVTDHCGVACSVTYMHGPVVTANIKYLYIRNYGTDNDRIFEYTIFSRTLYSNLRGFLVILCRFVVIL
jgi:hypothetical protein